jgi:hypothetical protein
MIAEDQRNAIISLYSGWLTSPWLEAESRWDLLDRYLKKHGISRQQASLVVSTEYSPEDNYFLDETSKN